MNSGAQLQASAPTPPAGERPDASLMMAIGGGDAAAFQALLQRHAPAVQRLAYRMMGDLSEAEDVVQDVFLKIWVNPSAWRLGYSGGLPAWLRRVATNLCLDRLRRRRFVGEDSGPERADDRPAVDDLMMADWIAAFASRAVNALPDRQRAAIVLTYYEELSNGEAAEILQMNIKAFESLLLRARGALRTSMTKAGVGMADLGGRS